MSFPSRWKALVEACVNGELMPFLGAGISYGARLRPSHAIYKDTMPTTPEILGKMFERVEAHASLSVLGGQMIDRHSRPGSSLGFGEMAQLFIDEFSTAGGEEELYKDGAPLDMALFRNVIPNPAHRYISFLAREGCFIEVITTNYDCGLEKAYAASFGHFPSQYDDDQRMYCSVSDQNMYRDTSHRRYDQRAGSLAGPVLHLFKINGCATGYEKRIEQARQKDPFVHCDGYIVITDRHLQDFDHRHWAQDLFRDRMRARVLLFSGFGADEAQIRFTALKVIEEFAQESGDERKRRFFLQAYALPLTPPQSQIARVGGRLKTILSDPDFAVFSGADCASLPNAPTGEACLNADLFWCQLYEDAALRIINKHLERTAIYHSLREVDTAHQFRVDGIMHDFRLRICENFGEEGPLQYSHWLREFISRVTQMAETIFLMQLCWRVREPSASACPNGYYEPFDDGNSLPLKLLLLFHLLSLDATSIVQVDVVRAGINGLWLKIPLTGDPATFRWALFVHRRPTVMPPLPDTETRIATCLTLDQDEFRKRRRPALSQSTPQSPASAVTWRTLSLAELIANAATTARRGSVSDRFRESLLEGGESHERVTYRALANH